MSAVTMHRSSLLSSASMSHPLMNTARATALRQTRGLWKVERATRSVARSSSILPFEYHQLERKSGSLTQNNVERLRFADGFRRSVLQPSSGVQRRYKSTRVESSSNPLSGLWKPTHLQRLHYGPDSVKQHLLECLPNESSKAFVLTGSSLANKTSLIKQVEQQLGSRHAQTFSKIGQHAPVKELDEATGMDVKEKDKRQLLTKQNLL